MAADVPAAPAGGNIEQVAAAVLPSVVKINVAGQTESGSGSGIILSKDGDILTNNHVVAVAGKSGSITVNFNDGSTARAHIVGTDPVTDIAVIRAEGVDDLTPARIGSSGNLRVGQSVIAVGSPYGLNATVTSGIVSALNRPVSVSTAEQQQPQDPFGLDPFGQAQPQQSQDTTYPAIQTNAAINPGNSGGPLVDLAGRVVGINSSIRTSSSSLSGQGGSIGLGFAIPIDEVMPIVDQLLHNEAPTHARLGVTVSDTRGGSLQQGALVRDVDPSAAGKAAGLRPGDVITKVDNEVIADSEALVATIRGHRPGDRVTLTYVRDGQAHTTTATLGSDANTRTS
jgi:putative serine protease PepD